MFVLSPACGDVRGYREMSKSISKSHQERKAILRDGNRRSCHSPNVRITFSRWDSSRVAVRRDRSRGVREPVWRCLVSIPATIDSVYVYVYLRP